MHTVGLLASPVREAGPVCILHVLSQKFEEQKVSDLTVMAASRQD